MKTIKQLREEYDNKVLNQAKSPERLMLEGRNSSVKSNRTIPLPDQMPAMLLFRRVAYRLYPSKQVVALYYSKTVDKYLSVPFGPDGNLNLSESTVYNTYDEVMVAEGAAWDAVKTVAKHTASGAAKGAAIGSMVGHVPGVTAGAVVGGTAGAVKGIRKVLDKPKVNERFHERLSEIREDNLDENAILKYLGGAALDKALEYFRGDKDKDKEKEKSKEGSAMDKTNSDYIRQKPGSKGHSSWKQAGDTSQTYQSRLKAATQKDIDTIKQSRQVAENKISHIRKMVNEGTDRLDMEINGRTIHINTTMAKRILEVYDSVNTKNKKIVESMLNEDLESFKKLLNFSIKV